MNVASSLSAVETFKRKRIGQTDLFESAEHYFFECELYNEQRNVLLQKLYPVINVSFPILTSWSQDCNMETNKMIIQTSIKYIKDTHRFD